MDPDIEKLVETNKLVREAGEAISNLKPGAYCEHKSWGFGKVTEWDLLGDRIIIDFNGKPAHSMKLEFAAKSLQVLPDEHVMTLFLSDPDGVKTMATDNPQDFVKLVLESSGNRLSLDELDSIVSGSIVEEAQYKKWWEATKKKLRQDRRFVVPSNRREPLELRAGDLSPAKALAADFEAVGDMKTRAKAFVTCSSHLGDFKEEQDVMKNVIELGNDLISKSMKLNPGAVFEMLLARDAMVEQYKDLAVEGQPEIRDMLLQEEEQLAEFIPKLPIAAQRSAYAAFPDAFGDNWDNKMLDCLANSGLRSASEMATVLVDKGKSDKLVEFVQRGIKERRLSSDLLAWVCKERKGFTEQIFGSDGELAGAVLNSMEKDHLDESASRSGRLQDALIKDKDLIADLMKDCEIGTARSLGRRLLGSPAFDDLSRRSLLARVIRIHPEVEEIVAGDSKSSSDDSLIVSFDSYEQKKKDLEHMVNVRIPANKKEIQTAREYGDLSENFEYKAAKQEEEKLRAERQLVDSDLKRAKTTDFKGADTSQVSIGTTVTFLDTDGTDQKFTILGAWDTDTDKGIISYLSKVAQAFIGAKIGDQVQLPSLEEGVKKEVVVKSIEPFV